MNEILQPQIATEETSLKAASAKPILMTPGPDSYRRRGSALAARTTHPKLDRNYATEAHRRYRRTLTAMPMLRPINSQTDAHEFITQ
jgi:hypothetical protein